MEANNYDNLITIKFARAEQPTFEERKGRNWVEFGKDNSYPDFLLDMYNESPKHGAIVKGKTKYIYGKGFDGITDKANSRQETWNNIFKKAVTDDEIFSGFYLQIVYNKLGKIADVFNLPFQKVRAAKDGSMFYVKDNWKENSTKDKERPYPAFNGKYDSQQPTQVLRVMQYNPLSNVYPIPSYYQALNYIDADVQVSRHILGNAKDGFVAGTLINLNNGEPQEEQKAAVEKGLKKKFGGSEGDRIAIMFNKSKDNAAEIIPLGNTMLTKEDFTNINLLIQQEIFAGHQITSPMLFGIKTEGQLGGRTEIRDAYEIFNNTYVNERQQEHENLFNTLIGLKTGQKTAYKILPVEPLGYGLKDEVLAEILPREYFMDKLGIEDKYKSLPPAITKVLPADGQQPAAPADPNNPQPVMNEAIKNLTGRQYQGVMRIVRQFTAGKLSKEQAALMLKNGFQFTDADVDTFLGVDSDPTTFSEDVDFAVVEQFSQCGESADDYEVLSVRSANADYFSFAKELNELEANVLDLIKKDKRATAAVIAEVLKQDEAVIEKVITGLEKNGVLKSSTVKVGEDKVTERVVTDKRVSGEKPSDTNIFIRYAYGWRNIVPVEQRNSSEHPSRPFCEKMMALGRLYSRAEIENISVKLGYSVFDRLGGWWTSPINPTPYQCRHEWQILTVVKKKK